MGIGSIFFASNISICFVSVLSLRIFSPPRRQITHMRNLSRELAQKIEDLRAKMNEVAACKGTNDAEFVALNGQMDELVNCLLYTSRLLGNDGQVLAERTDSQVHEKGKGLLLEFKFTVQEV